MEQISNPVPSISILLVEDEKVTLDLLVNLFTKKYPDITLHTAINGRTGLELFKSHTPDIVITDINMPEMDGVQMAEKIRSIKTDTKIIFLTGDTGISIQQDKIEKGFEFDHFIKKPVVCQELFGAVEKYFCELAQHQI